MSMMDDEGGMGGDYPPRGQRGPKKGKPFPPKGKPAGKPGMKPSMGAARPPNVVPGVPSVGGSPPPMPGPSGDALAALGYKGKK